MWYTYIVMAELSWGHYLWVLRGIVLKEQLGLCTEACNIASLQQFRLLWVSQALSQFWLIVLHWFELYLTALFSSVNMALSEYKVCWILFVLDWSVCLGPNPVEKCSWWVMSKHALYQQYQELTQFSDLVFVCFCLQLVH